MPIPPAPPRRRDAERNRRRILDAARAAFADPDADVSMAEVARRSGVGSATLYRNFASRRALLEALYDDELDEVCAAAATVEGETPDARLEAWLWRFHEFFTNKRPVALELLTQSDPADPVFTNGYARVIGAGRPVLRAAQRRGTARADLELEQVLDMIAAIARIPGEAAYREPILRAALDGLRRPV